MKAGKWGMVLGGWAREADGAIVAFASFGGWWEASNATKTTTQSGTARGIFNARDAADAALRAIGVEVEE